MFAPYAQTHRHFCRCVVPAKLMEKLVSVFVSGATAGLCLSIECAAGGLVDRRAWLLCKSVVGAAKAEFIGLVRRRTPGCE